MAGPYDSLALGMVETRGLVAAIEAADAMLKASHVRMVSRTKTNAALITIAVVGDVAAVQASVDAGRAAAERVGIVLSSRVIPRPGEGLVESMLDGVTAPRSEPSSASDDSGDLNDLTVRELRARAREREDLDDVAGRTISRATKDELIALLERS